MCSIDNYYVHICSHIPSVPDRGQIVKPKHLPSHQVFLPESNLKQPKKEKTVEEEVEHVFDNSQDEGESISTEGLVRVMDCLPSLYHSIIPYTYFNRIQSAVCHSILDTDNNIVISAPTVKTNVLIHS